MRSDLALTLAVVVCSPLCLAEKAVDLKPASVKPGKLLVDESFSGTELAKHWNIAKGDWQVQEGAVVGKEKKSDNHPAVLFLAQPIHNAVIRLSFKLDGTDGFALSLNKAQGHLFRVSVTSKGISAAMDKDKKDPASKNEKLGEAGAKFDKGVWYTMLVEFQGGNLSVQTDNGAKIVASHPGIDADKTGYRFVTKGESLLVDDIKVWEAAE